MDEKSKFTPSTSMAIVRTGIAFMSAMSEEYGAKKGLEMWDALRITMGDDVAGDILFGQLAGVRSGQIMLRHHGPSKINVIRIIRQYTGFGLKESKDISEAPRPHRPAELPTGNLTYAEIHVFAQDLRRAGADIEY